LANSFSKEEITSFDRVLEGFQDALVVSQKFVKFATDGTTAERAGNTIWRPQPYIAQSFTGLDQTANFARNYTQLSVPITLNYSHAVPLTLSATELRDALQEQRLGQAAMQRLASDINVDCSNLAALQGSIVVKRTAAASGFDDVAIIDSTMNEQGIPYNDRCAFYSSRDYNSMASNLQVASRSFGNKKSDTAYEKALVGPVANFDLFKLDYAYRLPAATATGVTITNTQPLFYTPTSTALDAGGLVYVNKDNRYQVISIAVTGSTVKVGDCFTIAGVNAVHHITKLDTGSLKTFRITAINTGAGGTGTVTITPPIISATGGTDPEKQYQNVTAAPTNGAAITFLNTVTAAANPFWQADAMQIWPGKYVPKEDSGLAVMSATTDQGITVVMTRQGSINDLSTKYRWDTFYGLACMQPEMAGIELFSQT
jgi:hypothetical protein